MAPIIAPPRVTTLRLSDAKLVGLPLGAETFVGVAAGGALAGSAPAEMSKFFLGSVLVVASFKAFWKRHA
jgi:uncharacterized membrane protein YfcA